MIKLVFVWCCVDTTKWCWSEESQRLFCCICYSVSSRGRKLSTTREVTLQQNRSTFPTDWLTDRGEIKQATLYCMKLWGRKVDLQVPIETHPAAGQIFRFPWDDVPPQGLHRDVFRVHVAQTLKHSAHKHTHTHTETERAAFYWARCLVEIKTCLLNNDTVKWLPDNLWTLHLADPRTGWCQHGRQANKQQWTDPSWTLQLHGCWRRSTRSIHTQVEQHLNEKKSLEEQQQNTVSSHHC